MATVRSRGFEIAYFAEGAGPAVVLVSGLSQWAGQWLEAGYVDVLSQEFRVIGVDPLGHGESSKPHDPDAYDPRLIASDVLAVLDAESVESATIWGFSMGASTALALASLAPTRVRGIVCGSGGFRDEPDAELAWCQPTIDLLVGPGGLRTWWATVGFDDVDEVARALTHNDADALASALEGSTRWRPDYEALRLRVMGYRGENEQLADNDALMRRLGAQFHVVASAGHADSFFRSADVLTFVHPFLKNVAGEDPTGHER